MVQKALLTTGLALGVAATLSAGERTRSAGVAKDSGRTEAAPRPAYELVAPGVAKATLNGVELTVNANGNISHEQVIEQFGSVRRWMGETQMARMQSAKSREGDTVFASGFVANYSDLTPTLVVEKSPISSVEEYKAQMAWGTREIGNDTMLAFANGMVMQSDTYYFSMPQHQVHRENVPNSVSGDTYTYADGIIYNSDAAPSRQ